MKGNVAAIWTIGHSNRTWEAFHELLVAHEIRQVADVRRFPGSRRFPQFGKDEFARALQGCGIAYEHFPELGGRRLAQPDSPNTAWRNDAFRGYADYMMTDPFRQGIDRLMALAELERTSVLCAEALWWQCHRALIADYLKAEGVRVFHIMSTGKIEEHPFTSAARIVDGKLSYRAGAAEKELELDPKA